MPAVTIVAAWIRAETGVGPSIASGSQTWSGICALLPTAPQKSSRQMTVIVPFVMSPPPTRCSSCAKTSVKVKVPKVVQTSIVPRPKPTSPTRFTQNALSAALFALSRRNQKPTSKYEQSPTASQKTKSNR